MKPNSSFKIMVVAGESGGHVFPAVGFCQDLKQKFAEAAHVTFVSTEVKDAGAWVPAEFGPVFLRTNKSIVGLLKLAAGALSLMWRLDPDIVFGFGGYITIPFVILARIFGKRVLIHEQNVVPGRANRFLGLFAHRIAVSFEGSRGYFGDNKRVVLARYPLRRSLTRVERNEALQFLGLDRYLFTVLVMGGSQGASRINDKVIEAFGRNPSLDRMQVIHLCGKRDYEKVSAAYKRLSVKHKVYAFLDDIHYAYSAADLVISRSGAGSVFEIMYFALPSIFIPYPYAGGHQMENARFLARKGASILLEDAKMSPEMINGLLDIFLEDSMRRKTMSALADSMYESTKNIRLEDIILS
ncbi:MAG TPA: hypothetical protein DCL35_04585 [Candidatus Omnitrophica bacterium]|nr:hypothetical protein [Candidatus Omnitrophota bacterium]